ncbi:hypothetical protein QBC32DRAFT_218937 [Pseudoneurospora amorphoporcata]|uniref:Uncharacterized protein n=1 Tax=Pseudoneurospora amorphoporcata TaxID=241081 RepID=A0AAN6SD07_9PEZI|nr:hypothetical protein QBC32DRAFT_218937 [Pseudoneurospora amorphoporcata]
MATSIFRPPFPEYDSNMHELPDRSITLDEALSHKLSKLNARRGRRRGVQPLTADDIEWKHRFMGSVISKKRQIRVSWVVDPTKSKDQRYENVDVPVSITEEICRAEADRLGLTCVVIRQLAHETRNVYKNGRTVTVWDASTGRVVNKQDKADSHFTVYMGRSKRELLLQGHIYVVWDALEFGNLKKVDDPRSQRHCVSEADGEKYVSEEYWSLTKDQLRLKQQEADTAPASSS